MAKAWIREYVDLAHNGNGSPLQIPQEPCLRDQTPVSFTASTKSAAFGAGTKFIAFRVDADAHYQVGDDPTATTDSMKVLTSDWMFIGVHSGQKIAFVAA